MGNPFGNPYGQGASQPQPSQPAFPNFTGGQPQRPTFGGGIPQGQPGAPIPPIQALGQGADPRSAYLAQALRGMQSQGQQSATPGALGANLGADAMLQAQQAQQARGQTLMGQMQAQAPNPVTDPLGAAGGGNLGPLQQSGILGSVLGRGAGALGGAAKAGLGGLSQLGQMALSFL